MAKKVYEEENIRAIADKIREKTGSDYTYKTSQMPDGIEMVYNAGQESGNAGYEKGFEDGKNSVVDYMKYAHSIKFINLNLFRMSEVNLSFEELTDLTDMFWANAAEKQWVRNTTVEHITISTKAKVRNIYRILQNTNASIADTTLKHITFNFELDTEYTGGVNLNNAFQNAKGIEIIDGTPLNVSNTKTFNSTFTQCINLREIRFVENTIKSNINFASSAKLTHDSLMSIINGLKDFRTIVTKTYDNVNYSWDAAGNDGYKNQVITIDRANGGDTWLEVQGDGYGLGFMAEGSDWPVVLNVHLEVTKAEAEEIAKAETFMLDDNNTLTLTYEQPPTETRTLTIGETNLAKLSDEEKAIATEKGWILA